MNYKILSNVRHDPVVPEFEYEFPLTEAQREIWVSATIDDSANRAFNLSTHLRISGPLDLEVLRRAAARVVSQHAALRCRFSKDGGSFRVSPNISLRWHEHDLQATEPANLESESNARIAEISGGPFVLTADSLIRFGVVRETADRTSLLVVVHHIVCDGWSLRIILDQLSKFYEEEVSGAPQAAPLGDSFTQFALRNAVLDASGDKQRSLDYWVSNLQGLDEPARLPPEKTRPPVRSYNAGSLFRWLDDELAGRLIAFGRSNDISLFSVLLTLYSTWMARLAADDEVVVGVPVAGQPFFDMPDLVGHCANMLPYRCSLDRSTSFSSALKQVQETVTGGYENQAVTFGEALKRLKIRRDASLVPLVPVTLNLVTASEATSFTGCTVERVPVPKRQATFELTLDVYREGNRLQLEAIYNNDLFSEELMATWIGAFCTLAESAMAAPDSALQDLSMVSEPAFESGSLISVDPRPDFDLSVPLTQLIDAQCQSQSDKTALFSSQGSLSYTEVHELSQRIAAYLNEYGAGPGGFVGVSLSRSELLPVLLLGIMKTGAAYLPVDPAFPAERRAYMLEDSGATLLLTDTDYDGAVPAGCSTVNVAEEMERIRSTSSDGFTDRASPGGRAYVIYTSGSTGNPKGVEVSHRNLTNFLLAMQDRPGHVATDRLLAVTSISFDISVLEMFLPLISGASLYVANTSESSDGSSLTNLIESQNISVMQGTPSSWRLLLSNNWKGSGHLKALCGGEPMPAEIIPELLERGCELWNMYGPTETTVWSTCCQISDAKAAIGIGTAVANNSIHILDASLKHCVPGISGEICIGGDGVTLGYLGREELTAERFVSVALPNGETERLYRTGDLGVLGIDGMLYHQGRMDFQLKVRGYRMEAGEIEACLTEIDGVVQAVVDAWPDHQGELVLIAYLVAGGGSLASNSELRAQLAKTLPGYMIPQRFEWRDEFPLTPNGKVDRKKLSPADEQQSGATPTAEVDASMSPTEIAVADIWVSLIGGAQPHRNSTFFEIGGHSLLAVRAINEMNSAYSVKIPVHLIALEELAEIAAYIDENKPAVVAEKPSAGARIRRLFRWVS